VVSVEVEVDSDRMRATMGGQEGRADDNEENDEMCRMRSDGPAQEVIKVEVSGVEVESHSRDAGRGHAAHARSSSVPRPGYCDRVASVA
jgi:hypothetical protein